MRCRTHHSVIGPIATIRYVWRTIMIRPSKMTAMLAAKCVLMELLRGGTGEHTCFILLSSLRVCSSFRRSFLFPTRIMGMFGQKCFTSGVHFSGIFSVKWCRQNWCLQNFKYRVFYFFLSKSKLMLFFQNQNQNSAIEIVK